MKNGIPSGNERAKEAPPSKPSVPPVEGWTAHEDSWGFKLASRRNRERRLGSHRVYKRAMSAKNHLLIAALGFALPAFGQGIAAAGVSPSHFFNLEFWQNLVTTTIISTHPA
jgi:hypothetical protein